MCLFLTIREAYHKTVSRSRPGSAGQAGGRWGLSLLVAHEAWGSGQSCFGIPVVHVRGSSTDEVVGEKVGKTLKKRWSLNRV